MHIHFDTVNPKNDTVKENNDTLNSKIDTVFSLIKENKHITANEISQQLDISLSTAKRRLKKLNEQGKIKRVGSDKTGFWEILV